MHLETLEGNRRFFSLVLLIKKERGIWVEELARRGFPRPSARVMLSILSDWGLIDSSMVKEPGAKGIRIIYRLTKKGERFAELLQEIERLLSG